MGGGHSLACWWVPVTSCRGGCTCSRVGSHLGARGWSGRGGGAICAVATWRAGQHDWMVVRLTKSASLSCGCSGSVSRPASRWRPCRGLLTVVGDLVRPGHRVRSRAGGLREARAAARVKVHCRSGRAKPRWSASAGATMQVDAGDFWPWHVRCRRAGRGAGDATRRASGDWGRWGSRPATPINGWGQPRSCGSYFPGDVWEGVPVCRRSCRFRDCRRGEHGGRRLVRVQPDDRVGRRRVSVVVRTPAASDGAEDVARR